jgi:hypothetical protein
MKKKLPVIIGLLLIIFPFKISYLTPSTTFFTNLFCFLSVLVGFLIILIFGSSDNGQAAGH